MRTRIGTALLVALLLAAVFPAVPEAQSVVTASILQFWRLLRIGGSFSGETLAFYTLAVESNGYINFGALRGSTSYGIRDNGGTIEFKNSGGSWAAASGGANPLGTFLVQTASGAPVNAQVMGSLGTGLVLNTTTTGVQSIYGGTTCTNQFPRSLNASGAATCASVDMASDVTGLLAAGSFPALTGDVTSGGGTLTTTLSTTGVGASTYGSATRIPQLTVDDKGRITAASNVIPQLTLTSTYFSSLDGSNLTNVPISGLSGLLPAANFPILAGDVTTAGGSLSTVVGSIGGKAVTLGGAFGTTGGAYSLSFSLSGNTSITLPTSGTMVSSTVSSLPSLSGVGTIATGTWQADAVRPAYGGTGVATLTAHGVLVGEGASNVYSLAGCTNAVPWWSLSSVDPICQTSPIFTSVGVTGSRIIGGTGVAGAASTSTSIVKTVTGIADGVATPLVTVTVPNAGEAAVVHVRILGSLGAGGAVGAYECSATLEGNITVARTSGVATVPTASSAGLTSNSCVTGATTITLAYSVSGNTGATGATQTFTVQATITKGGGSSANHQAVVEADVLNAVSSGITIS